MTHARVIGLAIVGLLSAGAIAARSVEPAAMRVTKAAEGYWFTEGDAKVLFYQAERKALPDGTAARSNYFHPLYDLDGNVVTEDFPKDHVHHRGIFWAWHQVLIDGKRVQDQWANRDSFWMVRDAKIAFIQTPHHFYSPDPFQRNLAAGTRVPPEGNMFYGLVQDGNDFWNAAFFCGSCAILRR